ncbi:hypothetical protein D3C76_1331200 [compost metagenome]
MHGALEDNGVFCFNAVDKLQPHFEVQVFEHDYERITPWGGTSGNALFVCVKR